MGRHQPPVILTSLCLHYLLSLRTLAFGAQILAIAATYDALHIPFPILAVSFVIVALSIVTLFSWWRVRSGLRVSERFFFVQLLTDVVGLTFLLYFTGGSANPFVSLLLLPVTVAAATLRSGHRSSIAVAAAICYTALMFVHIPDPQWGHADKGFTVHMWGMWLGFLLSAALVVYFVARMGSALREHDQALAIAREQALHADQLIALGTLAAGTAHELGTPLATMAVISKEMQRERHDDRELAEKLAVLRAQVDRCKKILSSMAAQAGQAQADQGRKMLIHAYLEELVTEWRTLRPQVKVNAAWHGTQPTPSIIADRTLSQAIVNLLNNAADASADLVEIDACWNEAELQIEIRDYGGGLPTAIRQQVGKPFVTSKAPGKGLGLGLYLARTTLNRLGGTVQLINREGSGVTAEIALPLSTLLASERR